MNNIYLLIPENKDRSNLALATVVDTKGSTPQKHGSSAVFDDDRLIAGTVGGGVLEGRVHKISQKSAKTGKSGIYHFDLNNDISLREEAICGGQATILIDASPSDHLKIFEQIRNSFRKSTPGILLTLVTGKIETDKKIERYWITSEGKKALPEKYPDSIHKEALKMLTVSDPYNFKETKLVLEGNEVLILFEPLFPPSHLIIAGAGHIGKSLAHIGKLLDFDITVVDDRIEYANPENIPDADRFVVEDIGKALEEISKDHSTFVVIVTRGHNDDAKALRSCINSPAGYIGMIGSKTKIEQMHREFVDNGWATEDAWSAVHAPIGLEIKSQTVEEIAVSIAAELVLVRNTVAKRKKENVI
jgi:xanthine dehydrogenase accessory factor